MTFLDLQTSSQKVILVFIFIIAITSLCNVFLSIVRRTKVIIPIISAFIFAFTSLALITLLAFTEKKKVNRILIFVYSLQVLLYFYLYY